MSGTGYLGVVLAAGGSRRFGGGEPGQPSKQLVEIDGEPLVRRVCRRALDSRLDPVVLVVGHRAAEVRGAVEGLAVEIVENQQWREGQSTSVKAGLAARPPEASAAVFVPCDQPFLTTEVIDRLVAEHAVSGAPIVVPVWRGRRGAPVLFGRELFAVLARIGGDAGGRQLFRQHPVVELAMEDRRPLLDFDTREELARLLEGRGDPD